LLLKAPPGCCIARGGPSAALSGPAPGARAAAGAAAGAPDALLACSGTRDAASAAPVASRAAEAGAPLPASTVGFAAAPGGTGTKKRGGGFED
jgi:hypothetical protein